MVFVFIVVSLILVSSEEEVAISKLLQVSTILYLPNLCFKVKVNFSFKIFYAVIHYQFPSITAHRQRPVVCNFLMEETIISCI